MPSPTETATPVDIANLDIGPEPPELSETLGVAVSVGDDMAVFLTCRGQESDRA